MFICIVLLVNASIRSKNNKIFKIHVLINFDSMFYSQLQIVVV